MDEESFANNIIILINFSEYLIKQTKTGHFSAAPSQFMRNSIWKSSTLRYFFLSPAYRSRSSVWDDIPTIEWVFKLNNCSN